MPDRSTEFPYALDDDQLAAKRDLLWQMRYDGDQLQVPLMDKNGRVFWQARNSVEDKGPEGARNGSKTLVGIVNEQDGQAVSVDQVSAEVMEAEAFLRDKLIAAINGLTMPNFELVVDQMSTDIFQLVRGEAPSRDFRASNPQDAGNARSYRITQGVDKKDLSAEAMAEALAETA